MTLRVAVEHSFAKASLAVAFEAPSPGVVALSGPSGAGKTSVLLAMAGLLRADRVRVALDNVALDALPAERRGVAVVFQDGRLFPHMRVAANLRYGLRRAGVGQTGARRLRFDDVVGVLGLGGLLARRPDSLSGGERQRVAIGRALLSQPRLLLMDEPLSGLDQARRDEILPYLARLRGMGVPIVYASHAVDEVMRLADTLVLMEAGRVVAYGDLGAVACDVRQGFAVREGAGGVLRGRVASHDAERRLSAVACGVDLIWVPLMDAAPGAAVRLLVPAREVVLALEAPRAISVANAIPAVVVDVAEDAAAHAVMVSLEVSGGELLARVTVDAARRLGLGPGRGVLALVKAMSLDLVAE